MAHRPRILHLLSQRPGRTGSGTTLDSLVRCAASEGYDQHVVVGTPGEEPSPAVGDLPSDRVHPLVFDRPPVEFPLPGMSDVMPYVSSVFSSLSPQQIQAYSDAWEEHLTRVIQQVQPDLIHSHHLWLMSSLVKTIAPHTPLVVHCHATGLRQMQLCPHLAERVRHGLAGCDHLLALTNEHATILAKQFPDVPRTIVGAGYRAAIFTSAGRVEKPGATLVYAGKFSRSKGLPWLLDAVELLRQDLPDLVLHVAGSGAGEEADALQTRMQKMAPHVVMHGQLSPEALADVMRKSALFVLPSFYEGLPLVLVEAVAAGCRVVSTDLPGTRELAGKLPEAIRLVDPPRLRGIDKPLQADLPAFVCRLRDEIQASLAQPQAISVAVDPFTWEAVFARVQAIWQKTLDPTSPAESATMGE